MTNQKKADGYKKHNFAKAKIYLLVKSAVKKKSNYLKTKATN